MKSGSGNKQPLIYKGNDVGFHYELLELLSSCYLFINRHVWTHALATELSQQNSRAPWRRRWGQHCISLLYCQESELYETLQYVWKILFMLSGLLMKSVVLSPGFSLAVPLVPLDEANEEAMENKSFRKLLRKLGLRAPANEQVCSCDISPPNGFTLF